MTDEYRGPERRDPPFMQPVEIAHLSNGARRLFERAVNAGESAIDEARKTRRWIVGSLIVIAAFLIAAGEFRGRTQEALDRRPTETAVRNMVDSVTVIMQGQQTILEVLNARQQMLITALRETQGDVKELQKEQP